MGVCQRCLRLFCRPRERRPAFTGRQITAFLPRSLCSCGRVTSQPFTWVLDKVYMNWINRHSPIDEGVAVGSCPINLVFLTQFGTCILCVPFNILERLIYARVETIIDPLLPREQVNFPHGRSAVDQVTLLTQDIEDSFSAKKKAGAVFVDLTATYDTVWHRSLTCKLLRLLPNRHMVHIIMEMVGNRSFTLTTGNSKRNRLRYLKNGVPRDLSWRPFSSTSTSLTCKTPSPESMRMLAT